jgi:hypothetical protein
MKGKMRWWGYFAGREIRFFPVREGEEMKLVIDQRCSLCDERLVGIYAFS